MALKIKADVLFKCFALSLFFLVATSPAKAQVFRLPLDIPASLSGNYGELRETHFHAGLDFKVGGAVGAKISAANSGFVSRISVSSVGYGNAIYIQHPNGKTTVYGHLLDFAPVIAGFVKGKQYDAQSFEINISLDSTKFPVKKGDFIGRAGNTGSSGGPHLHFEIRNTETQIPLEPIKEANFNITDNIPPQIQMVNIYSIKDYLTLPSRTIVRSYTDQAANLTLVPDTFYVAVAAIDRMNNTSSKFAIARYNFYLDNNKVYSFSPEAIPFDKGRYINAIVEYGEKQEYGRSMVKSWVEPGNALIKNITALNDGLFILSDNKEHIIRVELLDYKGNRATRSFKVKRGKEAESSIATTKQDSLKHENSKIMLWFTGNNFEMGNMKLSIPIGSLYSSFLISVDSSLYNETTIWRVHNKNTPLHLSAKLSIKATIPYELKSKALIASVNDKGRYSSVGGEWKGDYLEASIGSFGNFFVTIDTIAPLIFPSFKEKENISTRKALKFTIKDELSGIDSYKVTIDDKWILANFDAKTRSLIVNLDSDKIVKGKAHNLEIMVSDNRENINILKTTFIW